LLSFLVALSLLRAKTQRSRRATDAKAPKLQENPKSLVGIKGPNCSALVADVLRDLHKFKQPLSKMLTKRNLTRPFEDATSVEFLSKVNDASLFTYGSHSKKRPHNLVSVRRISVILFDLPSVYSSLLLYDLHCTVR
jgi:ribosome production factor 2